MQGIVQAIESKPTVKGTLMYKVTVDGIKYGTFDNPNVNIGDEVTFDASKSPDGKYDNGKNFRKGGMNPNGTMTSAYPASVPAPFVAQKLASANGNGNVHAPDPEREARIVRQNASSTAAILVAAIIKANPLQGSGAAWDIESAKNATFALSKDIFEVNFKGYDAGSPF